MALAVVQWYVELLDGKRGVAWLRRQSAVARHG